MAKPKIVIIGAGASGIAAASKLLDNGFTDLIILEAENRIGGRINSVLFDGGVVDLGAQWCHGEEDNIVYNTVKDLNLLSPSQNSYDQFALYNSTGRLIESGLTDILLAKAFEIAHDSNSIDLADGSFGDYFINRYKREIDNESLDQDELQFAKQVMELFHKIIICIDSAPSWFDISARRSLLYKHCEGNNYLNWKDGGYIKMLHVLMKMYPDPDRALPFENKILYQKEVNKISWREQSSATINCTDGTTYNADRVIVTVSLGVLKQSYKTLFDPELPLIKQNAIKYLGFGCCNKVFLSFPHKWWPDTCISFSLVWSEQDRENILKDFPHGPNCKGRSWLEDVIGFYVVDCHPRVLLVWIVGELLSEIDLMSDDILLDGCMFLLKKFVGTTYDIPVPVDMLRSKWKTNSHFYGAYSYQSMNSEKYNVLSGNLAEPLRDGNTDVVLFAGEATHPHYFSTVHGAIETGFREADRIINNYRNLHTKTRSQL